MFKFVRQAMQMVVAAAVLLAIWKYFHGDLAAIANAVVNLVQFTANALVKIFGVVKNVLHQ